MLWLLEYYSFETLRCEINASVIRYTALSFESTYITNSATYLCVVDFQKFL
jgi:hypothetical protein